MIETFFVIVLAMLAYTWLGYPLLLALAAAGKRKRGGGEARHDAGLPVTVLIAARDEEDVIGGRIANILESDYPAGLLDVLVVSDGSTDATERIVSELAAGDPRVRLLRTAGGGKSQAQNQGVALARGRIVVLTDAGSMFGPGTIRSLARGFSRPEVGCVSGRMVLGDSRDAIGRSQGLYWRFEMLLRRLESAAGTMHTASGLAMAFRKELYSPVETAYGDDCAIPLDIIARGYRVAHADDADAFDEMPHDVRGELEARVRMTLRNITCTLSRHQLLNPFRHPVYAVSIVSHKLLRWLTPYLLILLMATNLLLLGNGALFPLIAAMQLCAYAAGLIGFAAERMGKRVPIASAAFSFALANAGFFLGVLYAMLGKRITNYKGASLARADE